MDGQTFAKRSACSFSSLEREGDCGMPMKNGIQLITYPDSLGGDLDSLNNLLNERFAGLFAAGVHILPPFPSSSDRGFAPITYYQIDPRFGTWKDIEAIGERHDVILDLMVNHISRQSDYFRDFVKRGRASRWADLFITIDKVWPDSRIPPEDLAKIAFRKPDIPFSDIQIEENGQ
ncbi:MAG TPA: alpha-amylase family glycosyl hydrolase, partial [Rectinemataceae bacterium]